MQDRMIFMGYFFMLNNENRWLHFFLIFKRSIKMIA
jgi:hypothetical protein